MSGTVPQRDNPYSRPETVWVTENDSPDAPRYVVNDITEMYQNWQDMADDDAPRPTLTEYLASWQVVIMPDTVLAGPDADRDAWLDAHLEDFA